MNFLNRKRSRQLVTLALLTVALVLSGALAAYADSIDRGPSTAANVQAQDATPTATAVVAPTDTPEGTTDGAESAVMGSTEEATATATTTPTPHPTRTPTAVPAPANVIVNGGFEEGFVEGQGMGVGWGRFQNGNVYAGWYDDTWFKVVYEGEHAQLLELKDAQEPNRYVGIFQTVSVVPNAEYELTLHGLVRSDEGSPEVSSHGYRMQYAIDYQGGTNWEAEGIEWIDLMWDDQPREDPKGENEYRMEEFTTKITAQADNLTLFIRGWKKWPDPREGNFDIDGVSLVGPQAPSGAPPPAPQPEPDGDQPTATPEPAMPETGNEHGFFENPVLVIASAALLVILAGGAAWGLARRRT